jgi:hypothetical protein
LQKDFMKQVTIAAERALQAYYNSDDKDGPAQAVEFVTLFTVNAGNTVHRVWQDFFGLSGPRTGSRRGHDKENGRRKKRGRTTK